MESNNSYDTFVLEVKMIKLPMKVHKLKRFTGKLQ